MTTSRERPARSGCELAHSTSRASSIPLARAIARMARSNAAEPFVREDQHSDWTEQEGAGHDLFATYFARRADGPKEKALISRAFSIAGAGFEPATFGL